MMPYALGKLAAAQEIAKRPEVRDMPGLMNAICRKYGIFLEYFTKDEQEEFERMIDEYA